jgi:hypothetical protein
MPPHQQKTFTIHYTGLKIWMHPYCLPSVLVPTTHSTWLEPESVPLHARTRQEGDTSSGG